MSGVVALPARVDLASVATIAEQIATARGGPLRLDAQEVTHLGALGAQLMVAAAQEWRAAGQGFSIAPRSAAVDEALDCLGLADALAEDRT